MDVSSPFLLAFFSRIRCGTIVAAHCGQNPTLLGTRRPLCQICDDGDQIALLVVYSPDDDK